MKDLTKKGIIKYKTDYKIDDICKYYLRIVTQTQESKVWTDFIITPDELDLKN